jgi:HSP20 family protein
MGISQEWRPFRELDHFRRDFESLLERLHGDLREAREGGVMNPPMDCFVEDDRLTIRLDMPGVDPKDVEVHASGATLTISGKRKEKFEEKKRRFIRRECCYGSFERSITLPEGIEPRDLNAESHDGVLELTAPMPKAPARERVKIQVSGTGGKDTNKREVKSEVA